MDTAIRAQGLVKAFGSVRAVDGLDLVVPKGNIFGFLGPNGAGKTTTIHLLLGLIRPTAGRAEVLGFDVATHGDEVRARSGALLEHHGLYERLTALQNLDHFGRLNRLAEADRTRRSRELLEELGLWDRRDDPVGTWSKGMKQKLAIARALLHGPALLFLDEPTAGHDAKAAHDLRDSLVRLVRAYGVTVFLTTHNLNEAERICDRVGVIRAGRLIAEGRPADLRAGGAARVEFVGTAFTPKVVQALRRHQEVARVEASDGSLVVELHGDPPAAPLVASVVRAGGKIEEVRRGGATLEDAFLALLEAPRS